jgi:hypothetical protein
MQLEADLRAAQRDPRDVLVREIPEFSVGLEPANDFAPPFESWTFQAPWSEVFATCFQASYPKAEFRQVRSSLEEWVLAKIGEAAPHAKEWLSAVKSFDAGLENVSFFELITRIRTQFIGLGFIDLEDMSGSGNLYYESWVATERGRLFRLTDVPNGPRARAADGAS